MTVKVFDPGKSGIHGSTLETIGFTQAAADKVKRIQQERSQVDIKLRLFITGGGCSGFQYSFTFDDLVQEDDTVIETDSARLLIDPLSFSYLQGAEVDYIEGLQGARFVVNNPNAKSTCSCGASFTL